jgi:hypothetical protein
MAEVALSCVHMRMKTVNIVFMLHGSSMKTNSLLGLTSFQLENEKKILGQLFVIGTDSQDTV